MTDSVNNPNELTEEGKEDLAIKAFNDLLNVVQGIYKDKDKYNNKECTNYDYFLIKNEIHEQAISHKIAHRFENVLRDKNILGSDLSVDVEYNKCKDDEKTWETVFGYAKNGDLEKIYKKIFAITKKQLEEKEKKEVCDEEVNKKIKNKTLRPDIILHKRRTNSTNIIVIEIKKDEQNTKFDKLKLQILTNELSYNYKIGLLIEITKEKPIYTCFTDNDNDNFKEELEKLFKDYKRDYEINPEIDY